MNLRSCILIIVMGLTIFNYNIYGQITSVKSGNWNDPTTWVGSVVPDSSKNVTIAAAHTVTVNVESYCKDISFVATTSKLIMNANLNCYGNFNRSDTSTVYFTSWTAGAKFKFTGYAATQTITKLYTTSSSPYPFSMNEVVIDKKAGKFITSVAGGGYRFAIGTSLEVVNGTFEISSGDGLEGRNIGTSATTPSIIVDAGTTFNMVGSTSFIRRGNFLGEETEKIGQLTIYGSFYLACGSSTNKASFTNISIENGGVLYNTTGRGQVSNSFNPGTVTVKSGGTFYNSTSSNVWYTNTTTPTIMDLQDGGIFVTYSGTTYLPPNINNNGTVRYASNSLDQTIVDANYSRLELAYAGGNKTWTLAANRIISDSLETNNSATLTLTAAAPQTLTINGTIRLTSGTINNSNANTSVIIGNGTEISKATGVFSIAPTFAGIVNLKYTSSGSVTTGFEVPVSSTAINNFTVSGAGGIILGTNATVNGTLTLTNGLIITNNPGLLTLGGASIVTGGSVSSFVNGPISITASAGKTLFAPIGKNAAYRPLWSHIYSLTGAGTLTVEQIENPPTGTVNMLFGNTPVLSNARYFHVTESGLSGGSVDLTLSYGDDDGIIDSTSICVVGGTNGGTWNWSNNTGTHSPYAKTVTTSPFDPSGYTIGDCTLGSYSGNPMPVELTSFTATASNGAMKLSWKTATEISNQGFNVERSADKSSWTKLAFVQGQGNSNKSKAYSYSDNSVKAGKYYYRLRQIDVNGAYKYSNTIEADFVLPSVYTLNQNYPNPFNPNTMISYALPNASNIKISVYNAIGETVQILENAFKAAGTYSVSFNASNMPSGIYFYRIEAGKFTLVRKMMLVK